MFKIQIVEYADALNRLYGVPPMKLQEGKVVVAVRAVCECGGAKARTTHSHWCPIMAVAEVPMTNFHEED